MIPVDASQLYNAINVFIEIDYLYYINLEMQNLNSKVAAIQNTMYVENVALQCVNNYQFGATMNDLIDAINLYESNNGLSKIVTRSVVISTLGVYECLTTYFNV